MLIIGVDYHPSFQTIEIVEAAAHLSRFTCTLPCHFPALHRLCRHNAVRALFAVVPGQSVLLMWKT